MVSPADVSRERFALGLAHWLLHACHCVQLLEEYGEEIHSKHMRELIEPLTRIFQSEVGKETLAAAMEQVGVDVYGANWRDDSAGGLSK